MKKYGTLAAALWLSTLSLYASEGQIKREFTVTQIALDTQHAQLEQEEMPEDENSSSTQHQTQGGDTEK